MIRKISALALVALFACSYDVGTQPAEATGLIGCVTSGSILSGKCSSVSPLVATVSHDGTITGTGSAGSAFVSGTLAPAQLAALEFWGSGLDGTVVLDGTTTILGMVPVAIGTTTNATFSPATTVYPMVRDMNFANLTINSGVALGTNGSRVFVTGTLTNNGVMGNPGAGTNGSTAGGSRGAATGMCCATGAGGNGSTTGTASAGGRGCGGNAVPPLWPAGVALGTTAINTNGANGTTTGRGGAGGGGVTGGGGGTGGWNLQTITLGSADLFTLIACTPHNSNSQYGLGSGGGGGGGSTGLTGGGGGGAGGWVHAIARNIAGTGVFTAIGAPGGIGTAGAGGGGGGGGGLIFRAYNHLSGSTTTAVTGGAGGVNTKTGGTGGDGILVDMNMSGDGT